jgi:hypothetical protein
VNWAPPPIPDDYPGEVCRGDPPLKKCAAQPRYIVESSDAKGEYADLVCGSHLATLLNASMEGYGDEVTVRSFPTRTARERHERLRA